MAAFIYPKGNLSVIPMCVLNRLSICAIICIYANKSCQRRAKSFRKTTLTAWATIITLYKTQLAYCVTYAKSLTNLLYETMGENVQLPSYVLLS